METDWQEMLFLGLDGDKEAFGKLCRDYLQPRVYRFLLRRIRHPQDAEDLTQQVFEKVIKHAPRIRQRRLQSFEAFVMVVARNDCAKYWREHGKTHKNVEIDEEDAAERTTPCDLAEQRQFQELLDAVMRKRLSPEERGIFVMRALLDFSYRQIALRTGISISTLHARYQKILQKIAEDSEIAAYYDAGRRNIRDV